MARKKVELSVDMGKGAEEPLTAREARSRATYARMERHLLEVEAYEEKIAEALLDAVREGRYRTKVEGAFDQEVYNQLRDRFEGRDFKVSCVSGDEMVPVRAVLVSF